MFYDKNPTIDYILLLPIHWNFTHFTNNKQPKIICGISLITEYSIINGIRVVTWIMTLSLIARKLFRYAIKLIKYSINLICMYRIHEIFLAYLNSLRAIRESITIRHVSQFKPLPYVLNLNKQLVVFWILYFFWKSFNKSSTVLIFSCWY